jgi:hypothetical protein
VVEAKDVVDKQDDLKTSEAALEAMDPGETPGTRASVDRCEVVAEKDSLITKCPSKFSDEAEEDPNIVIDESA